MKRNFLLSFFIFLNITLMVFAEEWVEVYGKTYIKIDRTQNDKVFYWAKILNDGTMKPVDKQKIQYILMYNVENCSQSGSGLLATYEYGFSGKVLSSYISPNYNYPNLVNFEPVVPQSVGEVIHKAVCGIVN